MELTSNEAVKQSVLAGLGYSVMPIIGLKNELISGNLRIITVKEFPIVTNWQLIWLKNKKLSPVAKAYLNFIKDNLNHIVSEHFDWTLKY